MATGTINMDGVGYSLGGIANGVQAISYGGDNGVEFRIYGSDNVVYSLAIFVNAIALNVSYDGGQTWQNKWTK
jgi:hypothetical protein